MSTAKIRQSESYRSTRARRQLFRYSAWDAWPALLLYLELGLIIAFIFAWPALAWPLRVTAGALYAFAVGWTLDTVAHNFVHNPFFVWEPLNRATRYGLSLVLGQPQTVYAYNHMRHHAGSSDRVGPDGRTIDPISLYQYGRDDKPEPVLTYAFLQFWRDESAPKVIGKIRTKRPADARQALKELAFILCVYALLLIVNWRAVLFLAVFFYIGQVFAGLIAYYEHFGADPETPMATGVSTYAPIYNWVFLNNGYHNEHHLRPKQHWTKMKALRQETAEAQAAAGARVLSNAHFLGFLDRWTWTVSTAWCGRTSLG